MCRSKDVCSELGAEIEKWNTNCPLPTPRWMNDQINIFLDAVDGYTIEQLGISNPFNRVPIIDKWDGLVSKIPKLKSL